jgi:nucleoside-diphosphate-sugar epimerase
VAAYGFNFPDQVTEDHPLQPMGNTYVDTKIASEHAVLAFHTGGRLDCTIVRPGDVYGPGSRPWAILPLEMIASGKFLLPAHGEGLFSPVYIDDLVRGIALAAGKDEGKGQIYNISGDGPVTCNEFFSYYTRMLGGRTYRTVSTRTATLLAETGRLVVQLFGGHTEMGRGAVDMLSRTTGYSIEKARRQLGYQPETSLEAGMGKTEAWARQAGYIADS